MNRFVYTEEEVDTFTIVVKDFDPNQPRDPKGTPTGGQWTSGGESSLPDDASREAAERVGLPTEYTGTDAPDRFRQLIVDSPLAHSTSVSYDEVTSAPAQAVLSSSGETRKMSISDLRSPQDYVFPQRVEQYVTKDSSAWLTSADVVVADISGETVIIDGNHRVAAAKVSGASSISVDHKGSWTISNGEWVMEKADDPDA